MKKNTAIFLILFLINLKRSVGLEYAQQRYNPNSDFLLHEAGGNVGAPKRDYVNPRPPNNPTTINSQNNQQPTGSRDYVSQFPSLGTPYTTSTQTPKPNNFGLQTGIPLKSQSSSGKRDYVAPQYPNTKASQETAGRVKDLVNFYDKKNNDQNVTPKLPSYSSILQKGSNGHIEQSSASTTSSTTRYIQSVTVSTPKVSSSHTTKPNSFGAVVTGPNKPTITTPKPSTRHYNAPVKPTRAGNLSPTPQPGNPILPSSVVNRNRQQTNNNRGSSANDNSVSDGEIQTLSEELLRKDTNNAAKYVTVNYQEKTTSQSKDDRAVQPLLSIAADAWNIPTIQKFLPLLDNYERDTLINEHVTPQERNEENAFMDAIMATSVIRHLMNFLKEKGHVTPDPRQQRDFVKQLWFSLYSRGKGKISSSGFEHIFVSELKNGDVSGLHNWIYFSKEEVANRINYLGYLKYVPLSDKGVVMKLHFNQQGADKPVDSMFIGTSPELEIALYTLCFVTRADNECKLKLASKDVEIVTHTFRYRSKNLIGSAYPQI